MQQFNIDELTDYYKNPRSLSDKEFKQLKTSLDKFGMIDKPIVNADSANTIIGGHQRKHVLEASGVKEVECWIPDRELSEKEVEELNIRLNKNTGSWDFDTLANEFELDDLLDWGFDKGELDLDLWADDAPEDVEPQIDKAEELRVKWGVESGQLWQLGEHRLICGDCTDKAVVDKVMQGELAQGAFTSPPYAEQRKDQYGGTPTDEYVDWWSGVQSVIRGVLQDDGSFFVNIKPHCENGERTLYVFDLVLAMCRTWGWKFIDEFCWRRASLPGKWDNRFKNFFEPVYHFSLKTDIHVYHENVIGERTTKNPTKTNKSKSGSGSGIVQNPGGFITDGALPSNVIDAWNGEPNKLHPAMFPAELAEFFINAFSQQSKIWIDPFSGSGTTLIACERLGRKCRAVEISPAYVAVAIQRWVDVTGGEPVLLGS